MGELTQVVRDLTGAGDDFVMTSEFLEKNMELIEQAANGDTKAINLLGVATAKATVSAMEFSQEFADAMNKAAQEAGIDSPFEHLSRDFETNKSIVE
jgi:ribosomal protein S17E